ncbi:hypothetical protein A8A01_03010 [Ewingella americana]|nr:hypothetical protein A8A01_03010 [Ewingella americana]
MSQDESFMPLNNELKSSTLNELAEEVKAMRFAFGILYSQLPKEIKNGIVYQLSGNGTEPESAKRLAEFLKQLDVLHPGAPN